MSALLRACVAVVALAGAGCPSPPPPPVDAGPPPGALVHVVKSGDGHGTVKSAPAGIDCEGTCDAQDASFAHDAARVTLTATPARDALFAGWECNATKNGDPLQPVTESNVAVVAVDDADPAGLDVTCTASFRQLWTLLVGITGTGAGHVVGALPGTTGGTRIDCPGKCTAGYFEGDIETLTPTALAGSTFIGWRFDCSGTGDANVLLDADKTCEAHFCLDTDLTCP